MKNYFNIISDTHLCRLCRTRERPRCPSPSCAPCRPWATAAESRPPTRRPSPSSSRTAPVPRAALSFRSEDQNWSLMYRVVQLNLTPEIEVFHMLFEKFHTKHTGCPAVDDTTLIAHISLMPGPIIKPFHSMKVKTVRIFLVYDMSNYWLYYPILGMKMFLTRFSQKRKSAHEKCPDRIIFFMLWARANRRPHLLYKYPHLYCKCGLRFALAQRIIFFLFCVWFFSCALFLFWENLVKNIFIPKIG